MFIKNFLKLLLAAIITIGSFFVASKTVFAAGSLTVTKITAVKTYAEADNTYVNGWKWTYEVTVPTNETSLQMKFANWTSGSNSIPVADNTRFYSSQSSNASSESSAITLDAAGTYSSVMNLNPASDLDAVTGGIQIQITVEFKVPIGSANGSYSTTYGIQSIDPDIALVAADKALLVDASIKGANPDLANITVGLTNPLPSSGANGSAITWVSNNTSVVSSDGQTINRPLSTSENATVILTATLTKGAVTDTKAFTLTVTKNAGVQATPTFDPAAGAIAFGTTVTITSSGADAIYYTTDGSTPTTSSTNQATTPLVINAAVTAKALAVKAGYDNSAIGSAAYTQAATANLTGLALSGSPSGYTFAGGTYDYTGVTVLNAVSSITVTPTGSGTITVEGVTVVSGQASGGIALTAGTEKTITIIATETGKTAKTYTIKVTRFVAIGDSYQGGKVAYIDGTGIHGLIAATADQGTLPTWGCYGTAISGADGTAIGTGNQNTIDIMAGCATAGIAARVCGDLVEGGYSDWYLPSKDELNQLYINKTAIGGFTTSYYWSSSESGASYAWKQGFGSGSQSNHDKNNTHYVRAVRAF